MYKDEDHQIHQLGTEDRAASSEGSSAPAS